MCETRFKVRKIKKKQKKKITRLHESELFFSCCLFQKSSRYSEKNREKKIYIYIYRYIYI